MIKITDALIENVLKKAASSPRKRANYNFHKTCDAPIQRMLNAAHPGTCVRPHKHENPDKVEVFVILKGRALIVEFDAKGRPTDHMILDPSRGGYAVEIPPRVWHTFIALKPGTVLYEVKEGPYNKEVDKNFASWAPEEGTEEAQAFNKRLIEHLKI
ncbi:MAG: WbuC family cupin fold metalloprotein [Candidatus Omnitrophica bacterium]|nr:WbuC family cupin fold metalloprotein [Candidatus Omnitrophota bacterium]